MILIYSDKDSLRLQYILKELLGCRMGATYSLTNDFEAFLTHQGTKINYSKRQVEHALTIIPHGLLWETGITPQQITVKQEKWWRFYFFEQNSDPVPFDIFSAAFWLLSRYEEYHTTTSDAHGRFDHQASLAYKEQFLSVPLVDCWVQQLVYHLKQQFSDFKIKETGFEPLSTIDIDFAYRYIGIGLGRQLGKLTKSLLQLRLADTFTQLKSMFGFERDPYDTYGYIRQMALTNQVPLQYFVLMKSGTSYDKNINPDDPLMRQTLHKISQEFPVGLHPSYHSADQKNLLQEEKTKLEKLLQQQVSVSRQHFLRFRLPQTYQVLAEAGFTADYSMGYSNICGFRASTCKPFYFYNPENDTSSELLVYSPVVMDTALRNGMKLTAEQASILTEQLMNEVQKAGGLFISIWHNSNLGREEGWEPWRKVFEKMHTLASVKQLENGD